jgi:hypothetical protein
MMRLWTWWQKRHAKKTTLLHIITRLKSKYVRKWSESKQKMETFCQYQCYHMLSIFSDWFRFSSMLL